MFVSTNNLHNLAPHPSHDPSSVDNEMYSQCAQAIPAVLDFPKPGINFRDISPLLNNPTLRSWAVKKLIHQLAMTEIDVVVGLESRGFILGSMMAHELKKPFVMIRKPSKLPGPTEQVNYALEYNSSSTLEIQQHAIAPRAKVLIVDDVMVTGGSLLAACELVVKLQGIPTGVCCLVDLVGLGGSTKLLQAYPRLTVVQLLQFSIHETGSNLWEQKDASLHSPFDLDRPRYFPQGTPFILLCHSSMNSLARKIQHHHPHLFTWLPVSWGEFPDGYPNVKFPAGLMNKRVIFLASLYHKENFLEQLSLMRVLPRQGLKSLYMFYLYFAPGTMERVEQEGVLATADTVANITSSGFPRPAKESSTLGIFDLHNPVSRFSFTDDLQYRTLSAIPELLRHVKMMTGTRFAVAFPDEGSYKRFRGLIDSEIPMILCGKKREGSQRIVRIMDVTEGDAMNPLRLSIDDLSALEHVVIVDDLAQSGQTIFKCLEALKNAKAKKISAYVTHAVFPNRAYLKFLDHAEWSGLENFWITDSIPEMADLLDQKGPFKVISLVRPIIKELLHYYEIDSLPQLNVYLGSTSSPKIDAANWALETIFPGYTVNLIPRLVSSGVDPQPIGLLEGQQGCINRLLQLRANMCDREHLYITMENTIMLPSEEHKTPLDVGMVLCTVGQTSTMIYEMTEEVPVDLEIWNKYQAEVHQHQHQKTVGSYYQQYYPVHNQGSQSPIQDNNWSLVTVGKNRSFLLYLALCNILKP